MGKKSEEHHAQARAHKRTRTRSNKRKSKGRQRDLFYFGPPSQRRSKSGKKVGRPREEGAGLRHEARPEINPKHPLHVVKRLRRGLPSLRSKKAFPIVQQAFREACEANGVRLVEFSVQSTHLHMIVEVDESELDQEIGGVPVEEVPTKGELAKRALSKAMQSLLGKLAKRLNRAWGRKGTVWGDRYYAAELDCPLKVKRALQYVLNNGHKHGACSEQVDPCSSGPYFKDWEEPIPVSAKSQEARPCVAARTWLLREGWKRHGPIPFPVAA